MSSSSGSRSGSMFVPRSVAGRWVMLFVFLYVIWLTINHPSEAIDLFTTIVEGIGDIFSAIFQASTSAQEGTP